MWGRSVVFVKWTRHQPRMIVRTSRWNALLTIAYLVCLSCTRETSLIAVASTNEKSSSNQLGSDFASAWLLQHDASEMHRHLARMLSTSELSMNCFSNGWTLIPRQQGLAANSASTSDGRDTNAVSRLSFPIQPMIWTKIGFLDRLVTRLESLWGLLAESLRESISTFEPTQPQCGGSFYASNAIGSESSDAPRDSLLQTRLQSKQLLRIQSMHPTELLRPPKSFICLSWVDGRHW